MFFISFLLDWFFDERKHINGREKKTVLWNTMELQNQNARLSTAQCKRNKIKSKCSRQKETVAALCSRCDFDHKKQQHPCHGNEIIKIGLEVLIDWGPTTCNFRTHRALCHRILGLVELCLRFHLVLIFNSICCFDPIICLVDFFHATAHLPFHWWIKANDALHKHI